MMLSKSVIACAVAAFLTACGGGGGDSSASGGTIPAAVNRTPVANAGTAQSVVTGATITLTGSASTDPDADPLTYRWSIDGKPSGSSAQLSDPASVTPTWHADVPGSYTFSLLVNDGKSSSTASTVVVTVAASNAAPAANAGSAQSVTTGSVVVLDGSASSDANGDTLTYLWALTGKPASSTASLTNPTSPKPTFAADVAGSYVGTLTVSDGKLSSAPQTVTVTAAVANVAPVANAGTAQSVSTGTLVLLDGSTSSDANGDTLTYLWTLTGKPASSIASLANLTSSKPSFMADVAGSYVGTLTVSDGKLSSAPQTVTVTAAVANVAPVANAGAAQNILTGALVALDGSTSSDANGDALSFAWTLTSRPTGSKAALSSLTTPLPTFVADLAGTYVATLIVNDGRLSSPSKTVTISATDPRVIGQSYLASNGLTVVLSSASAIDLGNGYTRYLASVTQTNNGTTALSDTFMVLYFSDGLVLKPGLFTSQNVLPGAAFSVTRSYQYDAPSSSKPLLWEYGSNFFATGPVSTNVQWVFPLK